MDEKRYEELKQIYEEVKYKFKEIDFKNLDNRYINQDFIESKLYINIAATYFEDGSILLNNPKILREKYIPEFLSNDDEDFLANKKLIKENFTQDEMLAVLLFSKIERQRISRRNQMIFNKDLFELLIKLLELKKGDSLLFQNPEDPYCNMEFLERLIFMEKDIDLNFLLPELVENRHNGDFIKRNSEERACFIIKTLLLDKTVNFSNINEEKITKSILLAQIGSYGKSADVRMNPFIKDELVDERSDIFKLVENKIIFHNSKKTIFLANTGILFSERNNKNFQYLIENKYIEGIIELPQIGNRTYSIIILSNSNEEIKIVDSTRFIVEKENENTFDLEKILEAYDKEGEYSKKIHYQKAKEYEYNLKPTRLIVPDDLRMDKYFLLKDKLENGETIAEINKGASLLSRKKLQSRFTDEDTKIKYLEVRNIDKNLDIDTLDNLKSLDENERKFLVKSGSILISRMQNFESMVINIPKEYQILPNDAIFMIEINEKSGIDPYYIQAYLSSNQAQEQINRLSSGNFTKVITFKALEEIKFPKFSPEEQAKIVEKYKEILAELKSMEDRKKELEEEKEKLFGSGE